VDFSAVVKSRLATLGHGQRDLARAAQVTDSYISQLLNRRKAPPARDRTDIYTKMESFLGLEPGELGRLADSERAEQIKRKLGQPPAPLFGEFRDLVLRKCVAERRDEVRAVFESRPFGTLEQLVTRTLLDLVQGIARQELDSEGGIRLGERVAGRSHEELRVAVLEFLDTDLADVSSDNCVAFIDPLVESWDVDLDTLHLDVVLDRGLVPDPHRRFAFVESPPIDGADGDSGLEELLADPRLGTDVTGEEVRLLRRQRPVGRRPTKLFYYRALQNLRDPLNFLDD